MFVRWKIVFYSMLNLEGRKTHAFFSDYPIFRDVIEPCHILPKANEHSNTRQSLERSALFKKNPLAMVQIVSPSKSRPLQQQQMGRINNMLAKFMAFGP